MTNEEEKKKKKKKKKKKRKKSSCGQQENYTNFELLPGGALLNSPHLPDARRDPICTSKA